MEILRKVLQIGLLVALTCSNISCNNIEEKPIEPPGSLEKGKVKLMESRRLHVAESIGTSLCGYDPIERYMQRSDFCIMGKLHVKTKDTRTVTGSIEVISIIYGDPKTQEIPFSGNSFPHRGSVWGEGLSFADLISYMLYKAEIGQVVELILLGKGTEKNITLICPVELDALPYVKAVKNMQGMGKKEFQKERKKLLADSDDLKIFAYLCRRSLKEEGVEGAVLVIKELVNGNKVTRERKLFAHDLSFEVLENYPLSVNEAGNPLASTNESQQKELVNIIIKQWEDIKTIKEGLDYIANFNMQTFSLGSELKKQIQKTANTLSERFKNDKDYPEWEKWVNKIFPPEATK